MRIVDWRNAKPGAIVVYDKYGDAFASVGDRGHTAVYLGPDPAKPGYVITMESRGGVGVCFASRPRTFWILWIEVADTTAARVAAMVAWQNIHIGLGYWSGGGDNDHDGNPDRADVDDGNGIDCSGDVFLLFAAAWAAAEPSTPAPLPPPPPSEDTTMSGFTYFPAMHRFEKYWIAPNGHLMHTWGDPPGPGKAPATENMSVRYLGGLELDRQFDVDVLVEPDTFGSVIQLSCIDKAGRCIRMRYVNNVGWAGWAASPVAA